MPRTIKLTVSGEALSAFRHVVRTQAPRQVARAVPQKVLIVGAGGIGCELLKVAVLRGFRDLVVVDLDTIDATNLNRQFLFRKEDVGSSKAATARKAVLSLFDGPSPAPHIVAIMANIKDANYTVDYFKQFALVMNGLDNTSARKHVNRLCMQACIPLIESGTMGYNGQVQPILRGVSECYDCQPKSSEQKTFAVCTIHAHPSTMVHCTHFAKEFYGRLFGDAAGADEMAFADSIPPSSLVSHAGASALFTLLFHEKIVQLVAMRQQWPANPPMPLSPFLLTAAAAHGPPRRVEQHIVLPLAALAGSFVDAVMRCAQRARTPFKKDDALGGLLVAATANLRAACFHIPLQSVSDVVTIAGSIVPAIATTNAIIAASVVAQAAVVLADKTQPMSFVYVRKAPQVRRRLINTNTPYCKGESTGTLLMPQRAEYVREKLIVHCNAPLPPNPSCIVCSNAIPVLRVALNADLHTLGTFVERVLRRQMAMAVPFVSLGAAVLWEDEEMEGLRDTGLRRWVAGDNSVEFVVGCMNQSVEWGMTVTHDSAYLDVAHFTVNGTDSASADEMAAVRQAARPADTVDVAKPADEDEVQVFHPAKSHTHGATGAASGSGAEHRGEETVIDD